MGNGFWFSNIFKGFGFLVFMRYRATYHIIRADEEKKYLDVELYKFEAEDDSRARSLAEERLSEIKLKMRRFQIVGFLLFIWRIFDFFAGI